MLGKVSPLLNQINEQSDGFSAAENFVQQLTVKESLHLQVGLLERQLCSTDEFDPTDGLPRIKLFVI